MKEIDYVHGYSDREASRLFDQASTLSQLLHHDTVYPPGSRVLEAGCGTGAQTVLLARNSPEARIVSVDRSEGSLTSARDSVLQASFTNVSFQKADLFNLPFKEQSFDHVFLCFVLEHLAEPVEALVRLKRVLKKNGSMTVIEGDHGSWYCHPESEEAKRTVQCLVHVQAALGGNSLVGRQVFPLMKAAQFRDVRVTPRMVYVDSSRPEWVDGFSKKTFIAMVEGVRDQALAMGLVDEKSWDKGIRDLYRATEDDGTFCYTFFKGVGTR